MNTAEKFKIGNEVYCLMYGYGKIIFIHDDAKNQYPITVHFKNATSPKNFDFNGFCFGATNKTLFHTYENPVVSINNKSFEKSDVKKSTDKSTDCDFLTALKAFNEGSTVMLYDSRLKRGHKNECIFSKSDSIYIRPVTIIDMLRPDWKIL